MKYITCTNSWSLLLKNLGDQHSTLVYIQYETNSDDWILHLIFTPDYKK
jgi:hypothetical protein